jgi:hypothetical protein
LLIEVPLLATLRPDCPPSLDLLVRRALAQNPDDRFECAEAMEFALIETAACLGEEVGTPTLRDIARSVYASPDPLRLIDVLPNLPAFVSPSRHEHACAESNLAEPKTRPEGQGRSTHAADTVNPFVEASIGTVNASLIVARATSSTTRDPGRTWMTRTVPLTLAFVVGVILAAAVFELVRKKAASSQESTPSSAAHAAPGGGANVSATEPAPKR